MPLSEAPVSGWRVELASVFGQSRGDSRVCVAVIDGPVDATHPSIAEAVLEQLEPASADRSDTTVTVHGTSIASVLFGDCAMGVEGLVPDCRALLVPALHARDGVLGALQVDLARGIALALDHGAHIINLSAGQSDVSGEPDWYLADMVRRCAEEGVLLVAAAGNDGCACLHVPAASPMVLAVGAIDASGVPLEESNWGDAYRGHMVMAPGDDIRGAAAGGGTAHYRGTSWATAVVSGVAALLLTEQLRLGETPDPALVREAILETAIGCDERSIDDCRRLPGGRLNITGAWKRIRERRRKTMSTIPETSVADATPAPRPGVEALNAGCSCGGGKSESSSSCKCGGAEKGGCSCGDKEASEPPAKKSGPPLVFALGQLGYDFANEARRDSLIQRGLSNPYDPQQLLRYLQQNRAYVTAITWTLIQDSTTVYAVMPSGAFAAETHELLLGFLGDQLNGDVERISIAGWSVNKTTLSSGQTVPVLVPELRGLYSWSTAALRTAVLGKEAGDDQAAELTNFLQRIYYEFRNLGVLPQERAINFAGTNAFQAGEIYSRTATSGMKLDSIAAERSPICRPGSDCWDVKLTFFNPTRRFEQAREVYRLTVDVSDVVPVTVGTTRNWFVY